jgi:hypothetical protein
VYRLARLFGEDAKRSTRFLRLAVAWLVRSREYTNFTYDLSETSRSYIAATVSVALNVPYEVVLRYFNELEEDRSLQEHFATVLSTSASRLITDWPIKFGRRAAWYAATRILKPRVVVETGVDKGFGSCLLAAALMRNEAEGHPGRYFGTDINPHAGFLFTGKYEAYGQTLFGDSIASLAALNAKVDLFINDSDHSANYEYQEYRTIKDKLTSRAVIIGDNCSVTGSLLRFSVDAGRRFLFVNDVPRNHWDSGSGVGISFRTLQVGSGLEI